MKKIFLGIVFILILVSLVMAQETQDTSTSITPVGDSTEATFQNSSSIAPDKYCKTNFDCHIVFDNCGCKNVCENVGYISDISCARACTIEESDKSVENCECMSNECVPTKKNKPLVAVIVDRNTYDSLSEELLRYKHDVEKEENFQVSIKDFPVDSSVDAIKGYIKESYFNSNLEVVILVGEIPAAYYFPSSVDPGRIATDSYYYDVYDKCPYNETNRAFEARNNFCDPFIVPFVISRITPPTKGSEGIRLIKNYLDNNHDFRMGNLTFNQKALLYTPLFNDVEHPEFPLESLNYNLKYFGPLKIYDKTELYLSEWEDTLQSPRPKADFLSELSNDYQYVYVSAHGNTIYQDFDINPSFITNPRAFYLDFYSCNVGKFVADNYLAGNYLFNGKSLFVTASADLLFSPIGAINSRKLFLLKGGYPLSEIIKNTVYPSYIINQFGDPTLKMPQGDSQRNSMAKFFSKQKEIDFGSINVCETIVNLSDCGDSSGISRINFEFSNKGSEDLGFMMGIRQDYSLEIIQNSRLIQGYDTPYRINFDVGDTGSTLNDPYIVKPGETKNINISLFSIVEGRYSGKILIFNNDPDSSLIEIPYNVDIGIISNNSCSQISFRQDDKYCGINQQWQLQKPQDEVCENNFECESNVCVNGQCISSGLLEKILDWFKKLFG